MPETIDDRQLRILAVAIPLIYDAAFVVTALSALQLSREKKAPARLWLLLVGCVIDFLHRNVQLYRAHRRRRRGEFSDGYMKFKKWSSTIILLIFGLYCLISIGFSDPLFWPFAYVFGFDLFFIGFLVALAFVYVAASVIIEILCLCFLVVERGATNEDIDEKLQKFRFQKQKNGGKMIESDTDSPLEYVLSGEDAKCCICLCDYDDGVELHELPCRHHFHSLCVDKWLRINATCPLCKFNICDKKRQGEEV